VRVFVLISFGYFTKLYQLYELHTSSMERRYGYGWWTEKNIRSLASIIPVFERSPEKKNTKHLSPEFATGTFRIRRGYV